MNQSDKLKLENNSNSGDKIKGAIFLTTVACTSALIGFSKTVAAAKREEQEVVGKSMAEAAKLLDSGTALARRALAWGTLYAFVGTGTICFGIWKFSGAKNMDEFKHKMGSILPKITSNDPPTSRTDFEGLTDLLKYISTWGKE